MSKESLDQKNVHPLPRSDRTNDDAAAVVVVVAAAAADVDVENVVGAVDALVDDCDPLDSPTVIKNNHFFLKFNFNSLIPSFRIVFQIVILAFGVSLRSFT